MRTYKTIKELYIILYNDMVSSYYQGTKCICGAIINLYMQGKISFTERIKLEVMLHKNKPNETQHVKFYKNSNFVKLNTAYWWVDGDDSWTQRKLFVKKLAGIK